MKKNRFTLPLLGVGTFFSLALASCDIHINGHKNLSESLDEEGNLIVPMDIALGQERPDNIQDGVVLVKTPMLEPAMLGGLSYKGYKELSPNSLWQKVELAPGEDTAKAVSYLRSLNTFEVVDYDYVMSTETEVEAVDVSANPMSEDLPYIESQGIGWAWGHLKQQGKQPGGSADVIVAVIDTGVDYNHLDLRNNIWTNTGEIPNNGIDDDGNGYIDDVHGWNCVGDNNNPMDDNGHGTHVAGIVAAENNTVGTIGIAYNCKIMPIKAGNSSGYFNNSDLVEAVNYAYMNGASVINMSLGGYSIAQAFEDALMDAYNQCVLVAAAGNDGLCNQPYCRQHSPMCQPCYPGALPYVLGVMSCNAAGTSNSYFSNFDHHPYNEYEYEVYACGEQIPSTWPNNKYAALSGTSMASPVVAGIAALLRSAYPDRNAFSNKFINSQISNTSTRLVDGVHSMANAGDALTKVPVPNIYSVFNSYCIDSSSLSSVNNNDRFINAGETVKLGIELMNRGGKAKDVHVQLDTIRNGDPNVTDPYLHFLTSEFDMDDIGTYSIGDGGKHYEDGVLVDLDHAALVEIDEETPNGYRSTVNVTVTYKNGLDVNDMTVYRGTDTIEVEVVNGRLLPAIISEDTVFPATQRYILNQDMVVSKDVTVTFEAGCEIEAYGTYSGEINTLTNAPSFISYGTLIFAGSDENQISITSGSNYYHYFARTYGTGIIEFDYCDVKDMGFGYNSTTANAVVTINHSTIHGSKKSGLENGRSVVASNHLTATIEDSVIESHKYFWFNDGSYINGSVLRTDDCGAGIRMFIFGETDNTIFAGFSHLGTTSHPLGQHTFLNNALIQEHHTTNLFELSSFTISGSSITNSGNITRGHYRTYPSSLILNNLDSNGTPIINFEDDAHHDASKVWPFIENIEVLDENGDVTSSVTRRETSKARVTFSTDLDTDVPFTLFYGSTEPYADYKIEGDFVSPTVWEGEFEVTALIEGGQQYFCASGGAKADDAFKEVINNASVFGFNIDSSSAMSMDLQASPQEDGVHLSWVQDDYDTLMGYNVYRCESKDGNFVRINPAIIPAGENTFVDDNAEPGRNYWYTFTVVFSDFSESIPAGKVNVTCLDTIAPSIYHTPVNQGYLGNNLVISCTASDNVAVVEATLYYRVKGESTWNSLPMAKQNNRYSAAIFGTELSLEGMEYYIVVSDGRNLTYKGTAEAPYSILIKDSSALATLGDVDGDGVVTTRDALMIMQALEGTIILTDDQFQRADLNKDGELSSVEVLRILQYVNGKVNTLEM